MAAGAVLNLLDESLYADIPPDGTLAPAIYARVASLLRHCEPSGADGIVFSGSTFGPAVEEGRNRHERAGAAHRGSHDGSGGRARRRILLVCTAEARACRWCAARSTPRSKRAGSRATIKELWVDGARDALNGGDIDKHDRLIAEQSAAAGDFDAIVSA